MVIVYDITDEIEPHTSRLTCWLGGEEWVEDLVDDGFFDTHAVIANRDDGTFFRNTYCYLGFIVCCIALCLLCNRVYAVVEQGYERILH